MPIHHIQPTFAGGEFAPSLYARVDVTKYGTGLKTARNFIIHPHGGASNRAGTRFVHQTKDSATKSRLIPFEFSTEQAYILEFGNLYCRFYMDGGLIVFGSVPNDWVAGTAYLINDYVKYDSGTVEVPVVKVYRCIKAGTGFEPDDHADYWSEIVDYVDGVDIPYEISTPYESSDLPFLRVVQSADVLFIVSPDFVPQKLTRFDHDDWEILPSVFNDGPFMPQNDTAITLTCSAASGTGKTLTASGAGMFEADHVGALFKISHTMAGEAVGASHDAGATSTAINCGGGWRLFATGASFAGTISLEYSTDGGSTWLLMRKYTNPATLSASGTEDEFVQLRYVVTRTAGSVIIDLNTDPYIRDGIVRVTAVSSATSATADVIETLAATTASLDWSEGSWSELNGYPSAIGFFQDRLCYGGTYSEPQSIWASEVGNYQSFYRSNPLADSDGISINLPSYKVNGIVGLVTLGDILAFTSSAEWSVGPTSDGIFTPDSIQTRCQGYRGSAQLQPVVIGNKVIYVQPSGATVRDLSYDANSQGYQGDNLSIFSNHLFTGHSILDFSYQQEPDSIVWFVRDDGVLLALTYMREQEMIAWTRHDTDGVVESVACIPADGYDELWVIVKRQLGDDSYVRYVERMERRTFSTEPEDQYYVDCGLTYGFVAGEEEAITVVSGLDHLEGLEVIVLADGFVIEDKVVSGGIITLDIEAHKVCVGLAYQSDIETLNLEVANQSGTLQGQPVQVPEVAIRFLNSRGGYIGPDEDNLVEIVQRAGEPLNTAIELYSGDYKTSITSTFDGGGRIFIRQSDPLPMTVLAVMPTVNIP